MDKMMQQDKSGRAIVFKIVIIIISFSLLGLAIPFIIMLLAAIIGPRLPDGSYLEYQGITAEHSKGRIYGLHVVPEESNNFYVKVGNDSKLASEINAMDLLEIGFVQDRFGYIKRSNPIYSRAKLSSQEVLGDLTLAHVEGARVPFSSSPDGPFLELPVSRKEFEKQFGKALRSRYSYGNPHDPR